MEQAKITTLATFNKLKEKICDDNYQWSMQISTSTDDRFYLGFTPIVNSDHVIIHEEYDMYRKLNNTRVVTEDFILEYINHLDDITFVSLRKHKDGDYLQTVYYRKDI
jgi:hypothetical protein